MILSAYLSKDVECLNLIPPIGKVLFCNTSSKKDKLMRVQVINLKAFSINLEV